MWFTDAARACARAEGGEVTRACVDGFMDRNRSYSARGLLLPVTFEHRDEPPAHRRTCVSVARWRDGSGWTTQGGDMTDNCFDVPQLSYQP
ncbi:Amino acid ABC transporter substrate-binding protein OS=Streptomyces alboniger OX=132473 GN=CP975_07240 PE=3 SV=1 [Streptomyces alboniger]